jgi:hypothetical protein
VVTAAHAAVGEATEVLVASPSMRRYHRPSCPLAAGKDAQAWSLPDHVAARRQPCGVCRP